MKRLSHIVLMALIAINTLVVMAMLFCAYTSYLNPHTYPNWSFWGMIFPVFMLLNAAFVPVWLLLSRRWLALPVIGMLLCAHSVRTYCPINLFTSPPEGSIKLLSYNVMGWGDDKSVETNEIYGFVKRCDADILCLQEYSGSTPIINALQADYQYHTLTTSGSRSICIFSRYPIISSVLVDFGFETSGSIVSELYVEPDTILLVNNHLESYHFEIEERERYDQFVSETKRMVRQRDADVGTVRTQKNVCTSLLSKIVEANAKRAVQADSIAAFLAADTHKYKIMCGDFNTPSLSYVHHKLAEGMSDAYTASGNGPGVSFNRNKMYFRIDNIMVSPNIEAYGAKVDSYSKASDHYPIFCWLKMD